MVKKDFYDNYSKKQFYSLYMDAMCNEISDSRFDRIKGALHELVHLGQYSPDSFRELLDVVFYLTDNALKDIESGNFRNFWKAYLPHVSGMPEDYTYMCLFLDVIYADYNNLNDFDEYKWVSNECMLFIRDIAKLNDKKIMDAIMRYNPDLGLLLINHASLVNYKAVYDKKYSFDQIEAYTGLECHLLVSFLMGIDEYSHDYSLPTRLLNEMVDKLTPEQVTRIGKYIKYDKGSPVITKQLLDTQYMRSNVVDEVNNEGPKLS